MNNVPPSCLLELMKKETRWLETSILLRKFGMLFRYYMTSGQKIKRPTFCKDDPKNPYYLQNLNKTGILAVS
jgi:hypothetical protein